MSTGMHSLPVYQVDFGNGGVWHFSSFYEHEHGDFVHHMRPSSKSELDKRSAPNPYNTIRWGSGGFGAYTQSYFISMLLSNLNHNPHPRITLPNPQLTRSPTPDFAYCDYNAAAPASGFTNRNKVTFKVVNLAGLAKLFPQGGTIGVAELIEAGAVRKGQPVKILGNGELSVKLDITADAFSDSARDKIAAAGGSATQL